MELDFPRQKKTYASFVGGMAEKLKDYLIWTNFLKFSNENDGDGE